MAKKKAPARSSGGQRGGQRSVREQASVVRKYLDALEKNRPRRGRKRTPESISKRISSIEQKVEDATPLQRLQLVQERMDLESESQRLQAAEDVSRLEDDFAKVAKEYSENKGISYAAWRELGVPAAVLKKAGIPRTRRS